MELSYQLDHLDVSILSFLSDGRNTPRNMTIEFLERGVDADADDEKELADRIQYRLRKLREHNFIDRIGPAQNSGLYELTDLGRFVAEHDELVLGDNELGQHILSLAVEEYRESGPDAAEDKIDEYAAPA